MLDEVDKLGADFRGDPSAALLEVLDPEQNSTFRDHYLDVDFDLSKVMFIATANMLETIPSPLLDRMEVLQLPGYSEEEKTLIAQKYIIPKQLEAHGLTADDLRSPRLALRKIIADYTREAGLRNLEREIAAICRKIARRRAEGKRGTISVGPNQLADLLGPRASSASWPTARESPASPPGWPGPQPAARSSSSRPPACPARGSSRSPACSASRCARAPGGHELPARATPRRSNLTPRGSTRPTCIFTFPPARSPRTAPRRAWRSPRP